MPAPTPSPGPGKRARGGSGRASGAAGGNGGGSHSGGSAGRPAASGAAAGGPRRGPHPLRRVDETSAGGLVVDGSGPVPVGALIGKQDRRGRLLWSLPKGHLEIGETAQDAAIREVAEETGIDGEIIGVLGTIDFWFVADRRRIHKTVHHFLLNAVGGSLSDEDVEVTEVAWVPLTELTERLAYPDERELIGVAAKLLDERLREEQLTDERLREEQSTDERLREEQLTDKRLREKQSTEPEQGTGSGEPGERPCA